jgi:hypothetical protein
VNQGDEHGNSLLTVAAQNGHLKFVICSALHEMCCGAYSDLLGRVAQLLVGKGANTNHQNVTSLYSFRNIDAIVLIRSLSDSNKDKLQRIMPWPTISSIWVLGCSILKRVAHLMILKISSV